MLRQEDKKIFTIKMQKKVLLIEDQQKKEDSSTESNLRRETE